jgi:amidohydrolase
MSESATLGIERIRHYFETKAESIRAHRRALHRIPEIGFEENETSDYIKRVLDSLGVSYTAGIGGTGIVAKVGKRSSGPKVAVRADIDGLPVSEKTESPYKSTHEGLMHACGHDAHVAMLLGVTEYLASIEDEIKGEVLLVFQPSEERSDGNGLSGAKYVLRSGLLDGVSAIIGMHVMSDGPAGKFGIAAGPIMASGDMFRATIYGKGGHDAFVHQTIDPIFLSTLVLNGVYGIRSRKTSPSDVGTISIGTLEAGTTANVIPDHVSMSGTIRTFDAKVRDVYVEELGKSLKIAETLGGRSELEIVYHVPETRNDAALASLARATCTGLFGATSLFDREPSMGVEDFAWYSHVLPSLFIVMGAAIGDGVLRAHHNPSFDIDDSILYKGSALLAATALEIMNAAEQQRGGKNGD